MLFEGDDNNNYYYYTYHHAGVDGKKEKGRGKGNCKVRRMRSKGREHHKGPNTGGLLAGDNRNVAVAVSMLLKEIPDDLPASEIESSEFPLACPAGVSPDNGVESCRSPPEEHVDGLLTATGNSVWEAPAVEWSVPLFTKG